MYCKPYSRSVAVIIPPNQQVAKAPMIPAKILNVTKIGMVKNSWGLSGKYKGIWYASKAFVAYKTMNILVHKDALPKDIAKKLGIK